MALLPKSEIKPSSTYACGPIQVVRKGNNLKVGKHFALPINNLLAVKNAVLEFDERKVH